MASCSKLEKILLFFLASFFVSCVPDTYIDRKIKSDGKVKYVFTTSGRARGISVERNDETQKVSDGGELIFPIIEGENLITAAAYNQHGSDPTPAEDSFYSPSEEEARTAIEETLVEKGYKFVENIKDVVEGCFIRNTWISLGDNDFRVDYWGIVNDKDFVINYLGYGDDLEKEILNNSYLSEFRISYHSFIRVPINDIKSKLEEIL